ncbi:Acyl carrier protein [subsurface metagenome]
MNKWTNFIIKSKIMDKKEVQKRVKNVVAKVLKINEAEISDNANFIFDLGAGSLQSVQLIAAFEEEFDIEMDEDKALGVQTISDSVDFIASYLE